MDEQKYPFNIQMSIRPLGKQKCPVDIQVSIRPMDEQKCPVDIQMSMQLRIIYCNTHVYTFHVCLCLLALSLHLFVIPLIHWNALFKYIKKAL